MNQINQEINIDTTGETIQFPPMTATELGNLWTSYMTYSFLARMKAYCANTTQDKDVKALMLDAQQIASNRINAIGQIFTRDGRVIPEGFSAKDVNLDAPKLYEDTFNLYYVRNMIKINLATNSLFLTTSTRADVRDLYTQFCTETIGFYKTVTDLMVSQGLMVRSPHVPTVNKVDYVREQNFLSGFLGEKRPLLALEISSLHFLHQTNFIGQSLLMGFKQVTQAQEVRVYLQRGIDLASKIMDTYSSFLEQENIPQPIFWDAMVTDSNVAPFSDKFMMFHTTILNAAGLLNIGAALSTSMRHDISASYMKTLADIANYAEDGVNLMIARGWLEEPPRHVDREEISSMH